jgi:hypothetical protein
MHVEEALACASFDPPPPAKVLARDRVFGGTVSTEHFLLSQYRIDKAGLPLAVKNKEVFIVLEGRGRIEGPACEASGGPIPLAAGQTGFIPAAIDGQTRFVGEDGRPLIVLFAQPSMSMKRLVERPT